LAAKIEQQKSTDLYVKQQILLNDREVSQWSRPTLSFVSHHIISAQADYRATFERNIWQSDYFFK